MELEELREQIDSLDEQIINSLARRFKLSKEVAVYKFNNNKKIRDKLRENAIIKSKIKKAKSMGISNEDLINKIFNLIIEESVKIQKDKIKELEK